jgi:hypothetical protein
MILHEGHTVQRWLSDYGYDLAMVTFDEQGYAESGLVFFQLKATDVFGVVGEHCTYDLDIRHYNSWKEERLPIILVFYDALKRRAFWVHIQSYFADHSKWPKKGKKSVRIRIPCRQLLNRRSVKKMREIKQSSTLRLAEGADYE